MVILKYWPRLTAFGAEEKESCRSALGWAVARLPMIVVSARSTSTARCSKAFILRLLNVANPASYAPGLMADLLGSVIGICWVQLSCGMISDRRMLSREFLPSS